MAKYQRVRDGQWVSPVRKGYRMACCDCGLVHKIDFALVPWARGKRILFRAKRLPRSTAMMRRKRVA